MDSLCRVRPSVGRSIGRYRVRSINPIPIEGCFQTWLKCSPQQGNVQTHVAHVSAQGQGHN